MGVWRRRLWRFPLLYSHHMDKKNNHISSYEFQNHIAIRSYKIAIHDTNSHDTNELFFSWKQLKTKHSSLRVYIRVLIGTIKHQMVPYTIPPFGLSATQTPHHDTIWWSPRGHHPNIKCMLNVPFSTFNQVNFTELTCYLLQQLY